MRIASLSNFSQLGLLVTSYTITPNSNAVNEGTTVTFTIATFGVVTGSTLYWDTIGTASATDFSDGLSSGSLITTGNSTTLVRTITQDASFEDPETFAINIRVTAPDGEIVATSSVVTISDRRYTLVPSAYTVTEGTSLSLSVSTVNVTDGTYYWTINNITSSDADFSAVSGSFSITGGTGTFSITTIADLSTEGDQTFTVSVRVSSISGTVVATTADITITDTSTTPISQVAYTTAGTYTWVCPAGVSSVSVICVGGGGGGPNTGSAGGGGGALAYGNNIPVTPGTSYPVKVGAGGAYVAGGSSYFSSATFLNANGGSAGASGNGNSGGGGGGAAGYAGNGGAGQNYSTNSYQGGAGGTASGTAMTAGYSGGRGGNGGSTVGGTFNATSAGTGGSGSGGRGDTGGYGQGGGGVGILGQGASGAAMNSWSGLIYPAYVNNGGSGGLSASDSYGGLYGGGAGVGVGGGGVVRIIWPGTTRYFPSTGTEDQTIPSGTFTFTTTPTTVTEGSSFNFIVAVDGSPEVTLYWTIKHGTTTNSDFSAVSGSFSKTTSNTITITSLGTGATTDRTFQLEIRTGSTSGYVVVTSSVVTMLVTGQQTFTTVGTNTFTVPDNVTSISVVAVGGGGGGGSLYAGGAGGGLGYKNNIAVTPGQVFTVEVGAGGKPPSEGYTNGGDSYFNNATVVKGGGGTRGQTTSPVPAGGTYVGDGGGNGGTGGIGGGGTSGGPGGNYWGSGGGAGGYAGRGGNGGGGGPITNSGGGGGGQPGSNVTAYGGAGGGVGLNGKGSDGTGATFASYSGSGGSGGSPSSPTQYGYGPYNYGAGGGGASVASGLGRGGQGGVRIVWPGTLRQFPSTNVSTNIT